MYDITETLSFERVPMWLADCRRYGPKDMRVVLVANKADLGEIRTVGEEAGKARAAEEGVPYIETSAKAGTNVDESFLLLLREIQKT